MSENVTKEIRIQSKGSPSDKWASDYVLLEREIGYETDTGRYKIGDANKTPWKDLPYGDEFVTDEIKTEIAQEIQNREEADEAIREDLGVAISGVMSEIEVKIREESARTDAADRAIYEDLNTTDLEIQDDISALETSVTSIINNIDEFKTITAKNFGSTDKKIKQLEQYRGKNVTPSPSEWFEFEVLGETTTTIPNPTDPDGDPIEISYTYGKITGLQNGGKSATSLIIPYDIDGNTVIGIEGMGPASEGETSNLVSVVLPNSVSFVGSGAFQNCINLRSIDHNMSTPTNPNSYYGCVKLETFTFPYGTERIASGAFDGCSMLNNIVLPNTIKTIEKNAFNGCGNLSNISLSSSLTNISEYAFQSTNLQHIELPEGLKTIGKGAFGNTQLKSIILPSTFYTTTFEDIIYKKEANESGEYNKLTIYCEQNSNGEYYAKTYNAPYKYTNLSSNINYKILQQYRGNEPDINPIDQFEYSIISIGGTHIIITGYKDTTITKLVIPYEINDIPVTSISDSVFAKFSNLQSVILPNNIETIGDKAFYDCQNLSYIDLSENLKTIGSFAFANTSISKIKIPDTLTEFYAGAFMNTFIRNITLPESVETIGTGSFINVPLQKMTIMNNNIHINDFYGEFLYDEQENVNSFNPGNYPSNLIIYCEQDSSAATFAQEPFRGINYKYTAVNPS